MWEADDSQDLWATPGNSPAASMAHGERMVGSELTAEDLDVDRTLRPQRLDDYCGQEHMWYLSVHVRRKNWKLPVIRCEAT